MPYSPHMKSDTPSWRDLLVMTPQAWAQPMDVQLQAYLYEMYHANPWNRAVHALAMAPITFGQMLLFPYYARTVWCLALVAYYLLALREALSIASALAGLIFAMHWTAAHLEASFGTSDAFRFGLYICVGCTLAQTMTHRLEARMPPIANGHRHKWVPSHEYYPNAPLICLARNFVIGCVLEFIASPKLLAVQALSLAHTLCYCAGQPEWWDEVQRVARKYESDHYAPIDFYPGSCRDDDTQASTDTADVKKNHHPHSEIDGHNAKNSTCGDDLLNFFLALALLPFVVLLHLTFALFANTSKPSSAAQQHSEEIPMPMPSSPDVVDDVEEMRARILRSEPFVVRSVADFIRNELSLPHGFDSDQDLKRCGVVKIHHETRDFTQLHGFVWNLFGAWRWALRHRPLWFVGNYTSSTAHIDVGVPSYNLYCLKEGRKRVVIFPLDSTAQENDLVVGSDQLFIPGSHDQAKFDAWLAMQPPGSYQDFELNAGEAVFFNATSLHYFRNLEPNCAAYSIRLPTLHMSRRLRWALFVAPFSMRWQVTKHSVVNLRGKSNSRRTKAA